MPTSGGHNEIVCQQCFKKLTFYTEVKENQFAGASGSGYNVKDIWVCENHECANYHLLTIGA